MKETPMTLRKHPAVAPSSGSSESPTGFNKIAFMNTKNWIADWYRNQTRAIAFFSSSPSTYLRFQDKRPGQVSRCLPAFRCDAFGLVEMMFIIKKQEGERF